MTVAMGKYPVANFNSTGGVVIQVVMPCTTVMRACTSSVCIYVGSYILFTHY